jgi:hypothetical protein
MFIKIFGLGPEIAFGCYLSFSIAVYKLRALHNAIDLLVKPCVICLIEIVMFYFFNLL